jgi:hypothetical protein
MGCIIANFKKHTEKRLPATMAVIVQSGSEMHPLTDNLLANPK